VALSDDQKAMLRLLAQREEGYEDIAALLGLSVGEVRARVREALAGLDGADARPVPPPPPPPSAPATPEPPQREPVQPPAPAAPRPPQPRETSTPVAKRAPRRRLSLPENRRRLLELAGGALVAVLFVLFATGAVDLGGGDSDSDSDGSPEATAPAGGKVTQAVLTAPDGGGDAGGRAVFGRVGEDPVLQVQAEGLAPTPAGKSYTVWLYRTPKLALRVGAVRVGPDGTIGTQLPLPVALLSYVAGGAFDRIQISLTDDAAYKAQVARAKEQERLPPYAGTTVLSGKIAGPLVRQK